MRRRAPLLLLVMLLGVTGCAARHGGGQGGMASYYADRFHGRADRVLARIEAGQSGNGQGAVPPEIETREEDREVTLFQLRLVRDIIEVWLFGRRIARLENTEDV